MDKQHTFVVHPDDVDYDCDIMYSSDVRCPCWGCTIRCDGTIGDVIDGTCPVITVTLDNEAAMFDDTI